MDLIYYRSDIKRQIEEYKLKVKKMKSIRTIFVASFIVLALVVFGISLMNQNYYLLFLILFLFFMLGIIFIIIYGYHSIIFYTFMHNIQKKIINGETKYNIEVLDKKDIMELIRESRFAEKFDVIFVKEGFKVRTDDYEGYYVNVNVSRSTGQASQTIINGEVYILNVINTLDYQIRNDKFSFGKSKRTKYPNYNICTVNGVSDIDDEQFYYIKKMFPDSKYVGIDYSSNRISIFNNMRFKHPSKFAFTDNHIIDHYNYLILKFENLDRIHKEFKMGSLNDTVSKL